MWQRDLLFYISIISPLIALAATAWGLSRETSKTENGEKRLTRAGQVAIALAMGSALIAVASLGLGEVVKGQDALAAQTAEDNKKNENRRQRLDDRRWQAFRLSQLGLRQQFLSDLQRNEARRQARDILDSQRLFAAVEVQRDRGIAASSRLFQIAQSQRVILQSQPLNSLHVQMTIGGFSEREFATLVSGAAFVAQAGNRDDEYDRTGDLRVAYDDAGMFSQVLVPALAMIAGGPRDYEEGKTLSENVLLVDLDGEGSWLLPIGATSQTSARGFLLNSNWLSDASNPHADIDDASAQDFGLCLLPSIALDAARRTITVTWIIPSVCLPTAMHRAGATSATARLSDNPKLVVFRGERPFSHEAGNVTRTNRRVTARCWQPAETRATGRFIELVAVPNGDPSIGVRQMLRQRSDTDMDFRWSAYDDAEHYGVCSLFQSA